MKILKCLLSLFVVGYCAAQNAPRPNVLLILADDLGIGDLSSYGGKDLNTPNIDALAKDGVRFLNAHAAAATCTPSRYSIMTRNYPFRQSGVHILPGDAKLIISLSDFTLPRVFKKAGYQTALVGKWHLGLGTTVEKDWNQTVKPGPNEVGFDYSFIFPATADRVPTLFLENGKAVDVKPDDPILVSYDHKVGDDPTGAEHPELLKLKASPGQGHDGTIVNGIGRIGWMSGGKQARWRDEELTFTFVEKAKEFLDRNKEKPFFLYYNATEPHVPRMPATMFKGKSGLGLRGDAILQLDHAVGQLVGYLKANHLYDNTLIIFTSDNGPVLDDGYQDNAAPDLHNHNPFGVYRGGKYSAFEAGVRMPFIVHWPKAAKNVTSQALISQVDLMASLAQLLRIQIPTGQASDSKSLTKVLLGKSEAGRDYLVTSSQTFSIQQGNFKYIKPHNGPKINKLVNIELGNSLEDQLFDLSKDPGEQHNIAKDHSEMVNRLKALLEKELQN